MPAEFKEPQSINYWFLKNWTRVLKSKKIAVNWIPGIYTFNHKINKKQRKQLNILIFSNQIYDLQYEHRKNTTASILTTQLWHTTAFSSVSPRWHTTISTLSQRRHTAILHFLQGYTQLLVPLVSQKWHTTACSSVFHTQLLVLQSFKGHTQLLIPQFLKGDTTISLISQRWHTSVCSWLFILSVHPTKV